MENARDSVKARPEYRLKIPKGIEATVVGSYKRIEGGVVEKFQRIEGKFVDTFLEKVEPAEQAPPAEKN